MSKITVKNIAKSFAKRKVLDHIDFEVEDGTVVSLLGPSGCGKTTTLKVIAGLLQPDDGAVFIGDENITKRATEKRGAVIVFQDHLLFPHLNVEQNIGFGLKMAKYPRKEIRERVEEMLDLVKLKGTNRKYPHELSGGQQQRIALARALAVRPKVLLLDEPFSNLDPKLRQEIRELTFAIQRDLRMTTILVTHDKEEALMSSDKIAFMLNGQIKQFGTPEELYQKPNSIEVAHFLGEKNFIPGRIQNGRFQSDIVTIHTAKGDASKAKLMIKPEDIAIFPAGTMDLEGTIVSRKYAGERVYYTVVVFGIELKVVSQSASFYNSGDQVSLEVHLSDPIIFAE
ncbi:ABC transporter ATP-binding protein [Bacillus benzoevorans]|uniref:Carnitine transport ATP-binding protein OpuCA n=1 Tax=Bacillus benzoevorans TaxID=1456 RepID=A0A7X0HRI6_9BACI|nr:ABC transporter ATP-binding protein [Bacillus benzoevorans]MBB6445597.1 ABC-type Fe3+/spermidine/putrescine transport system ATPase subunit [Bacillus benzoevorans]